MTGKTALSLDEPVVKTTACVTVLSEKECASLKETACIRCGRCADVCPMLLDPSDFSNALTLEHKDDKMEMLASGKVSLCIECGACADACPVSAITEGDGKYEINADECIECGACAEACPVEAPTAD